jgi:hypothetical protein
MISNGNVKKARKARNSLLKVLSDGKWHQAKELRLETHVSSKTLYKKLEQLKPYIETQKRTEKGQLKPTVHYRANELLVKIFFQTSFIQSGWEDLKKQFLDTKDFSQAIRTINTLTNASLLLAFSDIQNKIFDTSDSEMLETFLDSFAWSMYENLTLNLADLCIKTKEIDSIDFTKVIDEFKEN